MSSNSRTSPYGWFYRNILERMDAEDAHLRTIAAMEAWGRVPGAIALTDRLMRPPSSLGVETLGLRFRSPLVLAAGLDKDARAFDALAALGFGGVEVGTATNLGQPGNPKPRVWRVPGERALLNAMGFPNEGAEAHAGRLARRRTRAVIGVNIGKSKAVDIAAAVDDYRETTRRLAPFADYLALNVSSPNTKDLRSMQTVEQLGDLVAGVRVELEALGLRTPVLIKLAPDLTDAQIVEIGRVARSLGVDGIIATNTTIAYVKTPASMSAIEAAGGSGGLSGRPLRPRALEVLKLLAANAGGLPLIAVGGIEDAADAWERILAGATLIQAYTGFVYGGPLWPHRLNQDLVRLLADSPYGTIGEAVGKGSA